MGNSSSHRIPESTGKVILSNGEVFKYNEPLTVAELMLEHPQEVVVEYQPIKNGKKPEPLPADKKLEMKKLYIMLPIRKGKPTMLSSEDSRKVLVKTNTILKSKSPLLAYTGFLPLFVRICPAAGKENDDVLNGRACLVTKGDDTKRTDFFGEILEGRPEFLSLSRQVSGKTWKPSLDTITEKAIREKVSHWLV